MAIPHAHHHHEEDEICGQCTHQDCDEHEDAFHCHRIPQHQPSQLQSELQKLLQLSHAQLSFDADICCAAACLPANDATQTDRAYEAPPILPPGCVQTQSLRAPPAEV